MLGLLQCAKVSHFRHLWFSFGNIGHYSSSRCQLKMHRRQPANARSVLKGEGNPDVMRRLRLVDMDVDDEADDDFLTDTPATPNQAQEQEHSRNAEPRNVRIRSAEYISSNTQLSFCPRDGLPEFAIVGRSNVGKSSLINMLTRSKNLALTSKQPGKTRCINHFLINKSWYLVDLPGYGYAKASTEKRLEWNDFTKTFFLERVPLVNVLLLIDSSIPPQQIDLECAAWLSASEVPFSIVFTKADKAKKRSMGIEENTMAFLDALREVAPVDTPAFVTSSLSGTGAGGLMKHISRLRQSFETMKAAGRVSSPLLVQQQEL